MIRRLCFAETYIFFFHRLLPFLENVRDFVGAETTVRLFCGAG